MTTVVSRFKVSPLAGVRRYALKVPAGSKVLHVASVASDVCLWLAYDSQAPAEVGLVLWLWGDEVPIAVQGVSDLDYLGTALLTLPFSRAVHVFAQRPPADKKEISW